ncbi:MAG: phosphatase PAP2 family protein [Rhodothermales bacterium]
MPFSPFLDDARAFVADAPRYLRDLVAFLRARAGDVPGYLVGALVALIVIGLALWAFVAIVDGFLNEETLFRIDGLVKDSVERIATPEAALAMARVTNLSAPILVVVVTLGLAAYFAIRRLWDYLFMLALALGLGELMLYALKVLFDRARPTAGTTHDAYGASFPSGHAFTALVLYGLLAYLVWQITERGWARALAVAFAVGATLAVGFSRLYLGVHWLTDVLGGYAAGVAWLVFSIALVRFLEARREHRAAVAPPLHPETPVQPETPVRSDP